MYKKPRNIPQSAVLIRFIDPFVFLLTISLVIIVWQSQIYKSPVVSKKMKNPVNTVTAAAPEKKAEDRLQPIIFYKTAHAHRGNSATINRIMAGAGLGPMYNYGGNIHCHEALLNWFEWDVAQAPVPYNTRRFELRNCGIDRYQTPILLNAQRDMLFVGPSMKSFNQEFITFTNFEQTTCNPKTALSLISSLVAKKIENPPITTITPRQRKEHRFQPIIHRTAKRYQVDPAIIKAIIMAESGFNPKAVSHKGARGLMQLMPHTAKYLGVEDSFNPEHNIDGGVRYFKRLLDRFGCDVELALAAYNAGSRNVRKYDGVPPFKATKIYIKKVLTYYETYRNDSKDLQAGSC